LPRALPYATTRKAAAANTPKVGP